MLVPRRALTIHATLLFNSPPRRKTPWKFGVLQRVGAKHFRHRLPLIDAAHRRVQYGTAGYTKALGVHTVLNPYWFLCSRLLATRLCRAGVILETTSGKARGGGWEGSGSSWDLIGSHVRMYVFRDRRGGKPNKHGR